MSAGNPLLALITPQAQTQTTQQSQEAQQAKNQIQDFFATVFHLKPQDQTKSASWFDALKSIGQSLLTILLGLVMIAAGIFALTRTSG